MAWFSIKMGVKMSKDWAMSPIPFETIATLWRRRQLDGIWYQRSTVDNPKFDLEGIDEIRRKFFGFNTYNFFILYANIDAFNTKKIMFLSSERPEIDRWIISKLNHLIQDVQDDFSDYRTHQCH